MSIHNLQLTRVQWKYTVICKIYFQCISLSFKLCALMPVGHKEQSMWHCLLYCPLTVKYILILIYQSTRRKKYHKYNKIFLPHTTTETSDILTISIKMVVIIHIVLVMQYFVFLK